MSYDIYGLSHMDNAIIITNSWQPHYDHILNNKMFVKLYNTIPGVLAEEEQLAKRLS